MQMVDFNSHTQNQRMYGGTAGRKMGIIYEGKNYILKFPGNLKEQRMKNIQLSYSNSPVCEYIGSQIFHMLGFPVHDTILGERNGMMKKMQSVLSDEKSLEIESFSARRCIFELEGKN